MRPTRLQRWIAAGWPDRLVLLAGAGIAIAMVAPPFWEAHHGSILGILWFVLMLFISAVLGIVIAWMLSCLLVDALDDWWLKRNGSPFHVGDNVTILAGRHRGRTARVYDVWEPRHEVRVELSNE